MKYDSDIEHKKDWIPIWCEPCNQQGYIFIDDPHRTYYVICKSCGSEYSQAWCSECEIGGDFVREIRNQPSSWVCSDCKKEYKISSLIYKNPVSLYLEDMLSDEILDRIENSSQSRISLPPNKLIIYFVLLLGIIALVIASLFLPFILVPKYIEKMNINFGESLTYIWFAVWLLIWLFPLNNVFYKHLMKYLNEWVFRNSK